MAAPPETRADDGQPPPSPRLARKSAGAAVLAAAAAVKASFASWDLALLRDKLREADLYVEHSRLVVRKSLGSGAFASTRHAELRQGGGRVREVAVKTLRPELVHDPEQVEHQGMRQPACMDACADVPRSRLRAPDAAAAPHSAIEQDGRRLEVLQRVQSGPPLPLSTSTASACTCPHADCAVCQGGGHAAGAEAQVGGRQRMPCRWRVSSHVPDCGAPCTV